MKVSLSNIIKNIQPAQIFEEQFFSAIKDEADGLIESLEYDGAADFSRQLEGILASVSPDDSNVLEYNILLYWMYRLKLFAFSVLKPKEKDEIFKNEIVTILSLGLDVKDFLSETINFYDSTLVIESITKGYLTSLLSSVAVLGEKSIKRKNVNFKPTVGNWISQYQASFVGRGNKIDSPGTFHIVNFFNTNEFARVLDEAEKKLLRELLELYDWLLKPVIIDGGEPQIIDYAKPSYLTTQKFTMPDELREGGQGKGEKSSLAQPLVKKVEDVSKSPIISGLKPPLVLPKNIQAGMAAKPVGKELDVAIKPNAAPVKPVTAGLDDIRKEIEHKKALAQAEIEKKLEGLKKRGSSK